MQENFMSKIKKLLKSKQAVKTILFMDGNSKRVQESVKTFKEEGLIAPLLIFETSQAYEQSGIQQTPYLVIEQEKEMQEEFVANFLASRPNKETASEVQGLMKKTEYFSAMMLKLKKVDGAVGGLKHSKSKILRAAFKAIGPKKGIKTISSVMVLHSGPEAYIFTDISVNPAPDKKQLVDIAKNAVDFAKAIDMPQKVAFLSFSTASASTPQSQFVAETTKAFNEKYPLPQKAIGEVQFDSAVDPELRSTKFPGQKTFEGSASIFVFPSLNAGNIGYKIAQRIGKWGAIGPLVTGLNASLNGFSRGSTIEDIINTVYLTALQVFEKNNG